MKKIMITLLSAFSLNSVAMESASDSAMSMSKQLGDYTIRMDSERTITSIPGAKISFLTKLNGKPYIFSMDFSSESVISYPNQTWAILNSIKSSNTVASLFTQLKWAANLMRLFSQKNSPVSDHGEHIKNMLNGMHAHSGKTKDFNLDRCKEACVALYEEVAEQTPFSSLKADKDSLKILEEARKNILQSMPITLAEIMHTDNDQNYDRSFKLSLALLNALMNDYWADKQSLQQTEEPKKASWCSLY